MQVIGICRFSYPGEGGFQITQDTLEERIAYLYGPDRMAVRFALFETITLPALRAQTDGDFQLLIVIGDSLPAIYRERLEAAVADLPQAVIRAEPPGPHRMVMQSAINSLRTEGKAALQFRMDDDDAVAVDFVAQLRQTATELAGFAAERRHIAIDFNQGVILRPTAEALLASQTIAPLTAAGLGVLFRADVPLSVMNFAHRKLARRMPTVTLTGEDMWLRGHSDFNDSRQKPGVATPDFMPADGKMIRHLKARFNVDAAEVTAAFAQL